MNNITSINDAAHFQACLSESNALQVAYFYVTYSKSCRAFAQDFEDVANKYADSVKFLQLDADECEVVSRSHNVSEPPTVMLFKRNKTVAKCWPPDREVLTKLIEHFKD
ncbi:thioredoxin [Pandoraea captiosa]|uniref:Thioredoxin n=1 Tax=Pandoraea captiosa TaxID=2508302 RepID=A0A5E5A7W9_9BURK|nr:thioredoxin domain-containing protein [Pandoraea captiosa]VVE68583.1 thioredoxin [Pandoraea captiosa]